MMAVVDRKPVRDKIPLAKSRGSKSRLQNPAGQNPAGKIPRGFFPDGKCPRWIKIQTGNFPAESKSRREIFPMRRYPDEKIPTDNFPD